MHRLNLNLLVTCCLIVFFQNLPASSLAQSAESPSDKITEVYGSFASQLNEAQLAWVHNCLDRCTIIEEPYTAGETMKNLSALSVNKKYVSTLEPDTDYNPATFNPLKYNIDFFSKKDQYFRIDNTYVLKIAAKE